MAWSLVTHSGQSIEALFRDLPYGTAAVSVLNDENVNGQMATSWLGMPREGSVFPDNSSYQIGHWDFIDVAHLMVASTRSTTINLRYETGRQEHQDSNRAKAHKHPVDQ